MLRVELFHKKLRSGDMLRIEPAKVVILLADIFGSGDVLLKVDGGSGRLGNVFVDGSSEKESTGEQSLLHVPTKIFTTFESKLTFDISGILTERGLPRTSQMGLPQQSVTTMMLRKTRT
jgi:hypothetical protein